MQAAIVRWLHGFLVPQSVDALLPEVPGGERFLRSHGVDEIPAGGPPGVIGVAAALLAVDLLAWRIVAAMFDRERLVTGTRG
jgi:hypothetical protein